MKEKENRKSSRINAQHFISYDLLDDQNKVVESGMALSVDLSREGVLVENRTNFPIDASVQLHIAVGEDVVDILGSVRHSVKLEENLYRIGIHFEDVTEEKIRKIAQYHPEILGDE